MIAPVLVAPEEFRALTVSPEMKIYFYGIIPLYQEEMELKLKSGVEVLKKRFQRHKITEFLQVKRWNMAGKIWDFI